MEILLVCDYYFYYFLKNKKSFIVLYIENKRRNSNYKCIIENVYIQKYFFILIVSNINNNPFL